MEILTPANMLANYYISGNPIHGHTNWEFCIFTNGTTKHIVNDKSYICTAGDIFLLGPPHKHSLAIDKDHGHHDLYIDDYIFNIICEVYPEIYKKSMNGVVHFRSSHEELTTILSQIKELEVQQSSPDKNVGEKYKNLNYALAFYLCGIYLFLRKKNNFMPKWVSDLLTRIYSYEALTIPTNELIHSTGYSKSQFAVLFKKYTGTTLINLIINKRLEYAAEQLKNSGKSALEICGESGYDSYGFFNESFKKKYKMTPLRYRKTQMGRVADDTPADDENDR